MSADFPTELLAALNTRDTSLDGLTYEQLQEGVQRVIAFKYDDQALIDDDQRIAAEAKAARKLAKKLAKGK